MIPRLKAGGGGLNLGAFVPVYWYLAFSENGHRLWERLIPGRFKHVLAFAPLPELGLWVFVDPGHDKTEIAVVPDEQADIFLGITAKMTVLRMPCRAGSRLPRWGYWCTALVGHLVGLGSCALRPDSLYRQCLANGGVLIDGRDWSTEESPARAGAGG